MDGAESINSKLDAFFMRCPNPWGESSIVAQYEAARFPNKRSPHRGTKIKGDTTYCGMTLHHKPPVENRVKSTKSPCKRVLWGVK